MQSSNWLMLAIVTTFACFLTGCDGVSSVAQQEDKSFRRVNSTGIIRAGYISVPPKFIVDPNTKKMSGVMYDALEAAAKNMGLKVEYVEEVTWGTMVEAVESGRVDVVAAGVWPSSSRARRAEFSLPVFYSAVNAYVRDDDKRFDGKLQEANSDQITIATLDGEMSASIASTDFPKAKTVSLPQSAEAAQLMLQIGQKKADITFMEPAIALEYASKNPGQIREVSGVRPVRVFGNTFLLSKGETKLRRTLDVAMDELNNSGVIDKIIERYEKYRGSMLRRSLSYRRD